MNFSFDNNKIEKCLSLSFSPSRIIVFLIVFDVHWIKSRTWSFWQQTSTLRLLIYDEHIALTGEIKLYNGWEWGWRTLAAAAAAADMAKGWGAFICMKRYFSASASLIRFSFARRFWKPNLNERTTIVQWFDQVIAPLTFTWVSVRSNDAENSARSAMVKYCLSRNFCSNANSCDVVNGVRGLRFCLCLRKSADFRVDTRQFVVAWREKRSSAMPSNGRRRFSYELCRWFLRRATRRVDWELGDGPAWCPLTTTRENIGDFSLLVDLVGLLVWDEEWGSCADDESINDRMLKSVGGRLYFFNDGSIRSEDFIVICEIKSSRRCSLLLSLSHFSFSLALIFSPLRNERWLVEIVRGEKCWLEKIFRGRERKEIRA